MRIKKNQTDAFRILQCNIEIIYTAKISSFLPHNTVNLIFSLIACR